jgi:Cu/Ag efflux pump CusA
MKIRTATLAAVLAGTFTLAACGTEADTVNHNLDKDAETFKIDRRIQFVNGITGQILLTIEGRCSNEYSGPKVDVTCKVDGKYLRHTFTKADNVFAVSQQLEAAEVDPNHYKFVFRPQTILPDVDVQTDNTKDAR